MEVEIREFQSGDLKDVNQLLNESFSVSKKDFFGSEFHEVVAVVDSHVVGYLLLTKVYNPIKDASYYLIDYVCVSSEYRQNGIAKKMLEYSYGIAKKEEAIYLQLTCSTFRIAAHKLYEKCGFIKRESDIFRKEII